MYMSIFISIASYRDILCNKTIESIFENADNPNLIFIGICEQNNSDENLEKCLNNDNTLINKYVNNIKTIKIPYWEAKGPTYARYLCSTLYNNQDYFLQIDSHSLFCKSWDTKAINMIKEIKEQTGNTKIILSHYPKTYEEYPVENFDNDEVEVPRICQSFFNDRDMLSFLGAENIKVDKHTYFETPYIAAGMIFSEGQLLFDVQFDPNLDYLFVGEEISHSIRCWTSGYNIYTPSDNLVYHLYTRADAPKIWTDNNYSDVHAFNKIKMLIKLKNENWDELPENYRQNIEKYGLGNIRTLSDYYNFAGIDIINKKVNRNFCKNNESNIIENNSNSNYSIWQYILIFISLAIIMLFSILLIVFRKS